VATVAMMTAAFLMVPIPSLSQGTQRPGRIFGCGKKARLRGTNPLPPFCLF